MPVNRTHKKPDVPKEAVEAEKVARHMYNSLTKSNAPKAHPLGYTMGACIVLKLFITQAEQQGSNKEELKQQALKFISEI